MGGIGSKPKSSPSQPREPRSLIEAQAVAPSCDVYPGCIPVYIAVCWQGCCSPIGFFRSILFFILNSYEEIKKEKNLTCLVFIPLLFYSELVHVHLFNLLNYILLAYNNGLSQLVVFHCIFNSNPIFCGHIMGTVKVGDSFSVNQRGSLAIV